MGTISVGWPPAVRCALAPCVAMLHTSRMTLPDLGPERPGQASETRQMVERGRTETGGEISNPTFLVALAVIIVGLVVVILLVR